MWSFVVLRLGFNPYGLHTGKLFLHSLNQLASQCKIANQNLMQINSDAGELFLFV